MCGIAGFCLNPQAHTGASSSDLAGSLLLDIEHRGYHATGSAWISRDDAGKTKLNMLKKNISASTFVPQTGDALCKGATTAILHTRYATQGSPSNNDNNHPITRGRVALTHNGHIANDKELFKLLGVQRRAQVDSEAVTALIAFTAENYHPTEVLGQVQGTAALAWFNFTDGASTLHLARVSSSPLWIGQSYNGHIFYASTQEAVRNAAWFAFDEIEWEHNAQEGEYFRIADGKVVEFTTFKRNSPRIYGIGANWKDLAFEKAVKERTKSHAIKPVPMPF